MSLTVAITPTSQNAAAFSIPKGHSGLVLIQNTSAFRVFFGLGHSASDNNVFIPAASGADETLVPGVFTIYFASPILDQIDVFMSLLSSGGGSVQIPYELGAVKMEAQ